MIREATREDLGRIAVLHTKSFQDHFLPKLGVGLLGAYYREFLTPGNIFLVSSNAPGEIDGLLLGTPSSAEGRNRFVLRNKGKLFFRVLYLCFRLDKDTWSRVFSFLKGFFKRERTAPDAPNGYSLLSICVAEQAKGSGLAKKLLEEFEKRLQMDGRSSYTLTVHKANSRACRFYENAGLTVYKQTPSELGYQKLMA